MNRKANNPSSHPTHSGLEYIIFLVLCALSLLIGIVFVYQHWQELQTAFYVPPDTGALWRLVVSHYLMIGVVRSFLIMGMMGSFLALCLILFKLYHATEVESKILAFKVKTSEIEEMYKKMASSIEQLEEEITKQNLQPYVKELVSKTKGESNNANPKNS